TDGTLVARVVYFDANSEAEFARFKGKLKGTIVLTAPARALAAHFEPLAARKTDSELLALADAAEPNARGIGRRMRQAQGQGGEPGQAANRSGVGGGDRAAAEQPRPGRFPMTPEMRARMELARKKTLFLAEEGAALLVDPSPRGDGGTLFVQSASVPGAAPFPMPGQGQGGRRISAYDKDAPKITPQIVMAGEHYNRLVRMIQQEERPRMVVDLSVQFHDEDLMSYNTVAEIPGTDKADEVVMLGGHMDSWHSGTGATDNGAGVAVAMEAVRILKALD